MLTFDTKPALSRATQTPRTSELEASVPSAAGQSQEPVQRKVLPNFRPEDISAEPMAAKSSGSNLPNDLQQRLETKSGLALDDVRVHRNSPLPERLGAHAFTKGEDIHLGPGQEKHLSHEAWHTVQQKQGRVKANDALFGIPVNDQSGLEREADAVANGGGPASLGNTGPMDHTAESVGSEGVVQGVFMKNDGETPYTKEELDQIAKDHKLDFTQKTEMYKKHGYRNWMYLSSWLEKKGIVLPKKQKRLFSRTQDEEDSDEDEKEGHSQKVRKLIKKDKKKVSSKLKANIFRNNLKFANVPKQSITKRKYYPAPSFDFSSTFGDKLKKKEIKNTQVDLTSSMNTLKNASTKTGFRGNVAMPTFELVYSEGKTKGLKTKKLKIPGLKKVYESSDHFSGSESEKKNVFEGIQGLHQTIGLKVSNQYGTMLHSERNMVYQFDKNKIHKELRQTIVSFANKNKGIKVWSLILMLYSDPNEVCTNCGTALYALTQAEKITKLGQKLTQDGVDVGEGFGLRVVTGALQLDAVRPFNESYTGKTKDLPEVMHTFSKE